MRVCTFVAIALSISGSSAAHQSTPSAMAVADSLQKKYDTVRDFTADFVHVYESGVLRRKTTERGRLMVRKPGMMRWDYESPEKKLFVSDGAKIYSYLPAERQVIVADMPAQDQATTPVLFLIGKGRLMRDFTVSFAEAPDAPADAQSLTLTPVRKEPEYESLMLTLDRRTLQIRRLAARDRQGGMSVFTFSNLKENVGLPDKPFRFSIPPGVDIVTDAQPAR